MNKRAEDPKTKANAFRESPYDSKEWDTMLSDGTHTIKDMKTALAAIMNTPPTMQTKTKKPRL